jgi:acyl-coenzyme A thioesterase PaaI-like protein
MNKQTLGVRLWALKNVFLIWMAKPTVVEVNERRCVVKIPLTWRTKNHLRSMYFGALCIGADVAGGLIAFHLMQQQKVKLSFVFKDVKASFLKRPEDDAVFTCEDGEAIQNTVRRALETGEREETTVHIVTTCPRKLGNEPVATFELTLSLKKK